MSEKLNDVLTPEEILNMIDALEDGGVSQEDVDRAVRVAKKHAKIKHEDRAVIINGEVTTYGEIEREAISEEEAEESEKVPAEEMFHLYFPEFFGKPLNELSYIELEHYEEKIGILSKKAWERSGYDYKRSQALMSWSNELRGQLHNRLRALRSQKKRTQTPLSEGCKPLKRFSSGRHSFEVTNQSVSAKAKKVHEEVKELNSLWDEEIQPPMPAVTRADNKGQAERGPALSLEEAVEEAFADNDYKVKIKRAYEIAIAMQNDNLIPTNKAALERKVDAILHLNGKELEELERKFARTSEPEVEKEEEVTPPPPPVKRRGPVEQIGDAIAAFFDWIFGWLK